MFSVADPTFALEVEPTASLAMDMFSNLDGGIEEGTSVLALLDAGLTIRASAKTGFIVNVFAIGGEDPSINIGDFNLVDNNAALDTVRLYRAYLYTSLGGAELQLGKLAVDDEFMLSAPASLFIGSGFGIMPSVSGNIPIPNYPLTALGVFARKSLSESLTFQAGIYDGNTLDERTNRNGFNNSLDDAEGLAVFTEANLEKAGYVLQAGTYVHTGELPDFSTGGVDDGNAGFYLGMDKSFETGLFNLAGEWFARASYSMNNNVNIVDVYADAGIVFNTPLDQRPDDSLGFAISYTGFGDDYINAQRASGIVQNNDEIVIEAIYKMELNNRVRLMPDFQYIINPANATEDAAVLGIRLEVSL